MELAQGWVATPANDDLRRVFAADDLDEKDWTPIAVPGHWRTNEAFADADGPLLYRTRFDGPAGVDDERSRWWLRFDGICYQGDIWLDGVYLGDTEGYFAPHTFEVSEVLRTRAEHVLAVEATCSPQPDRNTKRNITGSLQHSAYLDPAWNPGGLWRGVHLDRTGPVRISRLTATCTEATSERAVLDFVAELDADERIETNLHTTVGGVDHATARRLAAGANSVEWTVTIDRPDLWWPRALGASPLVDVEVRVELPPAAAPNDGVGDSPNGQATTAATNDPAVISDRRRFRTGVRTIKVRDWIWSVNGERIFVKGTNLAPTAQDLAGAPAELVAADIQHAADAGLDLVRVHGHVARPELYDAADAAGMLVWQDFPLQWAYGRTIRKQAVAQAREMVSLLAHHPSVALWCAHSEPLAVADDAHSFRHRQSPRDYLAQQVPTWNRTVLDQRVARAIEKADPSRPVARHTGILPRIPTLTSHASNLWFGWSAGSVDELELLARRAPARVRFVAEFGAQAVPETDEFLDPDRWPTLDWDRLETVHNLDLATLDHVVPRDGHTYSSWKAATQEHQAETVRRQIEMLRRLKNRPTGGFCQFHLADAHPAVSFALLDHLRRPKAGFAALTDACRPVIVVADLLPAVVRPGDAFALDVHVVSDRRIDLTGWVRVHLDLGPDVPAHRWHFEGEVPADEVARVGTVQFEVPDHVESMTLSLHGQIGDEQPENVYRAAVIADPN